MNKRLPYDAVIFTSLLSKQVKGYLEMSNKMEKLARLQDGFLGMNSVRNTIGITISYWDSLEAIKNWKQKSAHLIAQEKGKSDWYSWYNVKICKVECEFEFEFEFEIN